MITLLPGTEVQARGLRWEVVLDDRLGQQTLYRLRCIDGGLRGRELDLLYSFESIEPIRRDLRPKRAAPLPHWHVYHQAFLLEQALGPDALLAVQPGRLRSEPYQASLQLVLDLERRLRRPGSSSTSPQLWRRSVGLCANTWHLITMTGLKRSSPSGAA